MRLKRVLFVLFFTVSITAFGYAQSGIGSLKTDNDPVLVEIYPNPAADFVVVDMSKSELERPVIQLYNILGNKMNVSETLVSNNKVKLDIRNMNRGYYLISIHDEKDSRKKYTFKFLKNS